ncbi:hypothetical protein EDD21DRAFT_419596 [Dissophora ornata]|nr:hypothetical protein EDD21DRAFT_419596 [Dissophora ornata]
MQSDRAYQLPISNVAYHVYNPEDDLDRAQAVSKQAFQRTMDNYHEHEQLADRFQVELDKRERLAQERKEHEKLHKAQKQKSSKRSQHGRSQDRSHPQLPERHSLRRHVRNSSANTSNNSVADSSKDSQPEKAAGERVSGSHKRSRRNSDVSTSDISGYGDDDVRITLPGPKSVQHQPSSASSRNGGGSNHLTHSNERSLSSSPALPLTPSPRLTPSDARNENQTGLESATDLVTRSLDQPAANSSTSSLAASTSSPTFATPSVLSRPGHMITGRRKRKQAIPVHPSVVERIPGITLRFQREKQGDQLEVEILKNLDDYKTRPDGDQTPASKLQATQDIRKVKESIESGRPGYSFFPTPSLQSRRQSSADLGATPASTTALQWSSPFSSSLASLAWANSNGDSLESLATITDLFDVRSLPLSWENFSTRECVVNKVVGKHDKDLDILEEVVQDAIARQHYTHQHQQPNQAHHERDQEYSPAPAYSPMTLSGASIGSGAAAAAAASTVSLGQRSSKFTIPSSAGTSNRSVPTRATRSRTHISDGGNHKVEAELVAHEDIELVLKQKRKKKLEERRRLGSKASSKDEEEDDDDDRRTQPEDEDEDELLDDREKYAEHKNPREDDHDMDAAHDVQTDENLENEDEDVPMSKRNRPQRSRQVSSTESDAASERSRQAAARAKASVRARVGPARYRDESTPSSSDDDNDAEDDEDYRDHNYRATVASHRKRTLSEPKIIPPTSRKALPERKPSVAIPSARIQETQEKIPTVPESTQARRPSQTLSHRSQTAMPVSIPIVSSDGVRRNKKLWSRGRNTRKEDEVVDTTSDDSDDSGSEGRDDDSKMPLVKHVQSSKSMPTIAADISTADRTGRISSISMNLTSSPGKHASVSMTPTPVSPRSDIKKISMRNSPPPTPVSNSSVDLRDSSNASGSQESGGRTRARARSFSSTIVTTDKINFFESALDVIEQKRRETLAKKRAARAEAEERERLEREKQEQRDREEKHEKELKESAVRAQQQGKAQKIEASNLPKSSKSLPGRVLRRNRTDASAEDGSADLDCASCRLELSPEDKTLWRAAQESGEIRLPKTWGTHAILCTTCRQQYLDHHWRCTACFYVPVKEEMATSGASCSRCKAGTWLMEAVRLAPNASAKDGRRKNVSDMSV